ncbi:indeterminate-domain, partial [Thalictrum thalictroides]
VSSVSGEVRKASVSSSAANQIASTTSKRKRNLPGMPDPDAEVIALSPKTLMATNRFVCEICNKGFQRDQNLQLHRRGHNLPWKLRQRSTTEIRKRVYVCPETSCVHHDPSRALDFPESRILTNIACLVKFSGNVIAESGVGVGGGGPAAAAAIFQVSSSKMLAFSDRLYKALGMSAKNYKSTRVLRFAIIEVQSPSTKSNCLLFSRFLSLLLRLLEVKNGGLELLCESVKIHNVNVDLEAGEEKVCSYLITQNLNMA